MKIGKVCIIMAFCTINVISHGQSITAASYNIRFDNISDSGNLWADRSAAVIALIRFHNFDVFGTQEGLQNQLNDINEALPQYARHGAGRDDGREKGERSVVFYKKDMYNLLNKGNFWLSETPDQPSLGWDATCCNRICSWVYLQHKKSGKKFYFFNAHFDHQGVKAREESSKLILNKIKEIAGNEATVFTADLNGNHSSNWYQTLANSNVLFDTYKQVKYPYANNGSFNAFTGTRGRTDIIDHIFVTKHFVATRWGLLTDTYHGKYPSDHFPVVAEIRFRQ